MDVSNCLPIKDPKFSTMGDIKRASNQLRENRDSHDANDRINSYLEFRASCIRTSLSILQQLNFPQNAVVSARLKRLQSIYRKLTRSPTFYVHELDDVIGFRIVFQSLDDLKSAIASFQNQGIFMNDYLNNCHPKDIGYRGVHARLNFKQPFNTNTCFNVRFEVQLRTYYQHMWALWCESMGEQAKEGYPNNRDDPEIKKRVERLKSISKEIENWEKNNSAHLQKTFPLINDLSQQFAVVRGDNKIGHIDTDLFPDSTKAFKSLKYYESKRLKTLLFLGLSKGDIKSSLRETHLNWFNNIPDPKYWRPPK